MISPRDGFLEDDDKSSSDLCTEGAGQRGLHRFETVSAVSSLEEIFIWKFFVSEQKQSLLCVFREDTNESRVHGCIRETNILRHHQNQKHHCSSQPSMVHWLSSSIFPCCRRRRRPAMVTSIQISLLVAPHLKTHTFSESL